jgi:hypothetical protein
MSRGSFACALALIAALAPIPARAAWPPNGLGIAAATGQQSLLAIVTDGHGGAIVAWRDLATNAYRALRVTGAGEIPPEWSAAGDSLPVSAIPIVLADGAGGVFLVWKDFTSRVRAQRLGPDGHPLWGASGVEVVSPDGEPSEPAAIADGRGGLIVAWTDVRDSPPPVPPYYVVERGIYAQRLHSSGIAAWTTNGVAVGADSADQSRPRIVGDDRGGAIVIWDSAPTISDPEGNVHAQRVGPDGLRRWATNGVPIGAIPNGLLIPDARSGAIVVWSERRAATDDVFAQRVDSTGVTQWGPAGSPVCAAAGAQGAVTAVPDGFGGVIAAWQDARSGDYDIYASRLFASGETAPGWPTDGLGLCVAGQSQIIPVAFSDDSSGCVVAWCDFRSGAAFDIYAQRVSSAGAIATGWPANGAALCTAGGSQIDPLLVRDGSGGAIVAWNDGRSNGDVYGTRVSGAGVVGEVTTAVEMALVGADATPDRVTLRWFVSTRGVVVIERAVDGGGWTFAGEASPDASGLVRWEDRDVAPEHRYGYRIVVRDGADERRSAPAWITVPSASVLELSGFVPNPTRVPTSIAFALRSAAPARLEIVDVAGRLVLAREVGALGAGRHVVTAPATMPPGVYVMRLVQGGRSVSVRGCVIR